MDAGEVRKAMQTPMTDLLRQYMDANRGWVSEEDIISSIALLAGNGEHRHPPGSCTETSQSADRICGARSLVEYGMSQIHS